MCYNGGNKMIRNDMGIPEGTDRLEVYYRQSFYFDLHKLGINPKDVVEYYVKYLTLHVIFKDGTHKEYTDYEEYEVDYKWPENEKFFTENDYELPYDEHGLCQSEQDTLLSDKTGGMFDSGQGVNND